MSTDKILQIHSKSSEDTEAIGRKLGQNLRGGEVIQLTSDLGGGKTTMVRGIAQGLGSTDKVASPTFTISKVYTSDTARLVHYDFYRLQDPGLMEFEFSESLNDPRTVTVIEWADLVEEVLPKERVSVRLTADGEDSRIITVTATPKMEYVMKGLA